MQQKLLIYLIFCSVLIQVCFFKSLDELCSYSKINNTCECHFKTNDATHLPAFVVDCSRINLGQVPDGSDKIISKINKLDLSHNDITKLTIPLKSEEMRVLNLCYNKIDIIKDNYFEGVLNLENLKLCHNKLSVINNVFSKLTNLTHLDLSFNKLTILPDDIFINLEKITCLGLSYNNLGNFLMSGTNVLSSKLKLNKDVQCIGMNNLSINNFHNSYFDDFHQLKHLSLADNPLPDVPAIPYSVTYLDLSGTNLTTLAARHLNYHSLKILKLNRLKELYKIDRYAFYNLQSLEELSINDCKKLKEFDDLVFGIVAKHTEMNLQKLSIARSGLETLNVTYMYLFDKLKELDLSYNPWKCDCNLLWFQEFDTLFKNTANMSCASPYTVIGKKIMELQETDVNCKVGSYSFQRVLLIILGIAVFVLLCLIVYLMYMGPLIYRNQFKGIGPKSPYGMVTTQAE